MLSKSIIRPTPDFVERYISLFDQKGFNITDKAITRLVKAFPHNHDLEDVLLKVVVINSLYATNIYAINDVAKRICELRIDSKLEQGSLDLVDELAIVNVRGKTRRNYSFASKYCSWHAPKIYPIYDSFVDQLLLAYQKQDKFTVFKREELRQYAHYREVLDKFREHYELMQFGYKDLDKFLWLYGRETFSSLEPSTIIV